MTNTIIQSGSCSLSEMNKASILIIVLLSSFVIADQNIPLDLSLRLDANSVDNILARDDWREPTQNENNWRQQPVVRSNNKHWESSSVYENNNQLPPILSNDNKPSGVLDDRQAAPAFKLRF